MNKDVSQEKLFMFRVTPSAEYFVDNNNHSATAAFFTCYICPQQLPNHAQQQQLALRSTQQRRLPAFPGPQSHQQAPLHSFQDHHQPHAPRSTN
ncbi:hypothetical protein E4U35_006462 [Claviceps purpurea]|nr:hypothetical protein E4U35_006462 [Claviceps purpurea]